MQPSSGWQTSRVFVVVYVKEQLNLTAWSRVQAGQEQNQESMNSSGLGAEAIFPLMVMSVLTGHCCGLWLAGIISNLVDLGIAEQAPPARGGTLVDCPVRQPCLEKSWQAVMILGISEPLGYFRAFLRWWWEVSGRSLRKEVNCL